jgi:dihydrofolate reductase
MLKDTSTLIYGNGLNLGVDTTLYTPDLTGLSNTPSNTGIDIGSTIFNSLANLVNGIVNVSLTGQAEKNALPAQTLGAQVAITENQQKTTLYIIGGVSIFTLFMIMLIKK